MKKFNCVLLCVIMVLSTMLTACGNKSDAAGESEAVNSTDRLLESGYSMWAAVLYADGADSSWQDTVDWLEQSSLSGLDVVSVNTAEVLSQVSDLSGYDVVYLDESILSVSDSAELIEEIMSYTYNGGAVFAPNDFYEYFPQEYLGISGTEKIEGYCAELDFPECGDDLKELQQIVEDFSSLYDEYREFEVLSAQVYGWGVQTDTAISLVKTGNVTLYALNEYGEGTVFLVNPLLPNRYSMGQFTMESEDSVAPFASTTASFNQLLLSEYASYAAKEKYGYSLERVYGYYGTPSMSWELHYEEITGIANGALQIFSEMCEEYKQIPSYTLIRSSFQWAMRAESVSYLLNLSSEDHVYQMDYNESAYSSGIHVACDGKWLTQSYVEDAGRYFIDYPEYTCRAYPTALDYNGDGNTDLICGSEDGCIYYYAGNGFVDGRLKVAAAEQLTDKDGQPLICGTYSAPQMVDIDRDGVLDLICGYGDGTIQWFKGDGSLSFEAKGLLLDSEIPSQALPAVGDVNNDQIPDLAVGSNQRVLMIYYGSLDENGCVSYSHYNAMSLSGISENAMLGTWLAPCFTDWNKDGILDLAIGTFDGYVGILLGTGETYTFTGYIANEELNYKGNSNIKFGNYSVPVFFDLNGDGADDLLCGNQEFGMAYPIDSEYFPYAGELAQQVQYAKDHNYYMGVHYYTNAYASDQRELAELSLHKQAFEKYGLSTENVGTNQHTWFTSSLSGSQTMSNIYESGLLWTSGFNAPGEAVNSPESAAENVLALPFFLEEDGQWTTLVQNNSVLLYGNEERLDISARYKMPVCIFYHCDFVYESDEEADRMLQRAGEFQDKYGYNFNREDQMIYASAAVLHQDVEVQGSLNGESGIYLESVSKDQNYALYDEQVSNSLGIKIELSEDFHAEDYQIDADVWYLEENAIIVGLNRGVTISKGSTPEDAHIIRINMASHIENDGQEATISFLSGGMMQAVVQGDVTTDSEGWDVVTKDGQTTFTKYGTEEELHLIF